MTAPDGNQLGPRGRAIYASYNADQLEPPHRALVVEYGRLADLLDRMYGLVTGKREAWAELVFDEMGEVHLSIDKLLNEQRQTVTAFKALHAEMRGAGINPAAGVSVAAAEDAETPLEKRRRERELRERQSG